MEELKRKLNEFGIEFIELLQQSKDFVIEQLPDYVSQLLTYEIVLNSIYVFLSMAIPLFLVRFLMKSKSKEWFQYTDRHGDKELTVEGAEAMLFSTIFIIVSLLTFILHLPELLKLILAPKVWLLEYFTDLIR